MSGERGAAVLLAAVSRWAAEVKERGLSGEQSETLGALLDQSKAERLDQPADPLLVVMLCGPTAVGKSSLINALAGAEISHPGLGAETSEPVLYVHELDDPARLFEYSQTLGELGRTPASIVRHSRDALRHKVLVDTPDIDSVILQHRERTAELVHSADLVLFVTSPEKYKVLRAARWVADQSRQRALAFVLNKWDRGALGLQYERRSELERDVRAELERAGFSAPVLFRTSAVADGTAPENDLSALRSWLEAGLDHSATAAIQSRRQRAAWGRLAAAIDAALPRRLSREPVIADAVQRIEAERAPAAELAAAQALQLPAAAVQATIRPGTPGLFGGWLRFNQWVASWRVPAGTGNAALDASIGFGAPIIRQLSQSLRSNTARAALARIPLGPVPALWDGIADALREELSALPAQVSMEIAARAARRGLRRGAGVFAHLLIEALILAVLGMALWRLAADFVAGTYATGGLLLDAVALIVALLFVGQVVSNLFFPSLQGRVRRLAARRAAACVDSAWLHTRQALEDHAAAADRLADEGERRLAEIETLVSELRDRAGDSSEVQRLFTDSAPPDPHARARFAGP